MDFIAVLRHTLHGPGKRVLTVKLDAQRPFCQFPVVVDADVFDAHVVHGKERGDGGNGAWLIRNVHG